MQSSITQSKSTTGLLGSASFLMISTLFVNAGNYGINLFLGRFLGPEVFAEANVLATLVMILSFIAVGLQLCVAKFVASYYESTCQNELESLKFQFIETGKKIGLYTLPLLILISPILQEFLKFDSAYPLLILFAGVPFYFRMSISRGIFQGQNQFNKLASSYIIEMLCRLIVTIGLLLIITKNFYSEVVSLGFFLSFLASFFINKPIAKKSLINTFPKTEILNFILVIGIYELSQIIINNADVILVKHIFDSHQAGLYSSIALIGRVVFFATWTIVTLLFPLVIAKEKRGEDHRPLFWSALLFVAMIGITITIVCYFFHEQIITVAFGSAYLEASNLLYLYSLATCFFACANVFAYYHMSLNNYRPVFISITIGVIQFISIYLVEHNSLTTIIWIQIILMAVLLICMIAYHIMFSLKNQTSLTY